MIDIREIECPYCGELIGLPIDASAGPQRYIEDCHVCCRPITVVLAMDVDDELRMHVQSEDEA